MLLLLPQQRAALVVTTRTFPLPNEARAITRERRRAISAQPPDGRQAGWYRYLLAALFSLISRAVRGRLPQTNPGSMEEACKYGLMRGTCFVARRLEIVAVAGVLWISWCVLSVVGYHVIFPRFFASNAHGLLQVRSRLALFTSTLVMRPFFALRQKSLFIPGCVQGAII